MTRHSEDTYADLELTLSPWNADTYRVDLRFSPPGSDREIHLLSKPVFASIDVGRLRELIDPDSYGRKLTADLFADNEFRSAFLDARHDSDSHEGERLRLRLGIFAPELHKLRWETLCDPQEGTRLTASQRVLFSRYLSSQDRRRVKLRSQSDVRALVCIANPGNLAEYQLAPIDVETEMKLVRSGLGSIPITELAGNGHATLSNLSRELRNDFDILYLVCHGAFEGGKTKLYLENEEDGKVRLVDGVELITCINEMREPPRLALLVVCQSANLQVNEEGALVSLGPGLTAAGVPAVIAMQGNITMRTVKSFVPAFFDALQKYGRIDRAMAEARGIVSKETDNWMPALFMELKSGRIWYERGFHEEFEKWDVLISAIRSSPSVQEPGCRCIPILGMGLTDRLFGSRYEIATQWARRYGFPLAQHECEGLPEVAQFLTVNKQPRAPREALREYMWVQLLAGFDASEQERLKNQPLQVLMKETARQRLSKNAAEPHQVLANLPFDIYLTTNPDNLLSEALAAVGKFPQVELCHWNKKMTTKSIYEVEPGYRPTPERPLVYCLFGQIGDPNSLVLTEDDYFDFLIAIMRKEHLLPAVVRTALAERLLLFLGFQLDDWTFRVPFRYIMNQEGGDLREDYTHIAAQIVPDESRTLDPERAQDYLEKYCADMRFHKDVNISIYWGTVEDFAKDLYREWQKPSESK